MHMHKKYREHCPSCVSSESELESDGQSRRGRRRRRLSSNGFFLLLLALMLLILDATIPIPIFLHAQAFVIITPSTKIHKLLLLQQPATSSSSSLSFSKYGNDNQSRRIISNNYISNPITRERTTGATYPNRKLNPSIIPTSPTTTTQLSLLIDSITAELAATSLTTNASVLSMERLAPLADYAPAATSLFNNMKLPAAVVTAGMISLGFATSFPELPRETPDNKHIFTPKLRDRCEAMKRLHIVVALIAVTSELLVVLWAAVEVNQLTEKQYALAASVWDLIARDCDLAWSAVNTHFVLGIIGFVVMLTLRAYVMLLSAEASPELMIGASTGTGSALCLMISIVNRGVESGGGGTDRYGATMFDLFGHYAVLLTQTATNEASPGPLQLTAMGLELMSLIFMANVLFFDNGKRKYDATDILTINNTDDDSKMEEEEECSLIDFFEADSTTADSYINGERNIVVMIDGNNEDRENVSQVTRKATKKERKKLASCLAIEEMEEQKKEQKQRDDDEEDERRRDSENSSVSIV